MLSPVVCPVCCGPQTYWHTTPDVSILSHHTSLPKPAVTSYHLIFHTQFWIIFCAPFCTFLWFYRIKNVAFIKLVIKILKVFTCKNNLVNSIPQIGSLSRHSSDLFVTEKQTENVIRAELSSQIYIKCLTLEKGRRLLLRCSILDFDYQLYLRDNYWNYWNCTNSSLEIIETSKTRVWGWLLEGKPIYWNI